MVARERVKRGSKEVTEVEREWRREREREGGREKDWDKGTTV